MSLMPQQQMQGGPQIGMDPADARGFDEQAPQIGPNLASDPEFCKLVLTSWFKQLYPQVLQQQRLWPIWERIDDAFRVKGKASDLDISAVDPQSVSLNPDKKGAGGLKDRKDGYSARVYPATFHKQVVTKTDMHKSIAWSDGLPVRAEMEEGDFEDPLYNPIQRSVDALNAELVRCARVTNLEQEDRKGRGAFCKYGHAWALPNFEYRMDVVPQSFAVPQDPQMAQQMMQDLMQRFGSPPQMSQSPFGMVATWQQRTITKMETRLIFMRVDDVFVDQTLPADNMDMQLCPTVRSRVNRTALFGNDYDPISNPFGYLNCQQAMTESNPQWTFSTSDTIFQQELLKKWGLSMSGQIKPANALKQKWMGWPMLAIYQDPKTGKLALDEGEGVDTPQGKVFVKPERYVVEAFGNLEFTNSSATVLRIQRNPTPKDRVPLLFAANLTEDTAGAIPLSKAEAAIKATDQEATCLNQFFNAKNKQIDPSWLVPTDFDIRTDLGKHGTNFPTDEPERFKSLGPTYDFTQTMMEFQARMQAEGQAIMGMSDQLLGNVSTGRRPATELQNAFDASKMPITIEIDQYNAGILGQWALFHKEAIEMFADRAYLFKVTGRIMGGYGALKLFTAVADEFMKRQAAIGNFQYMAQMVAPLPGANLQPIIAAMWKLMKLPGNPNEILPDGGFNKARDDAMQIITQICGFGRLTPPTPSDPHQIYIGAFTQALKDPYWQEKTPETLPLLNQRLMMQIQLFQQQQQMQMAIQQHQLAMAHMGASLGQHFKPQGPQQGGNGNQPAMSNQPPQTSGGANQQLMGGVQ